MRVSCPLLAFYGSQDEAGGEKELALLKSSVRRLSKGPRSVKTTIIAGGIHEYVGQEAQVAQTIAQWADTEVHRQ
jgi:hypothetical protein